MCRKQMNMPSSEESREIQLLFIQEELSQHGEWLSDLLTDIIERQELIREGALLDSINYGNFMEKENPGLRFSFYGYGRAIDMAAYKRNRHEVDAKSIAWGEKQNKMKRKNTKWYAKHMYEGLYRLVSRIMYGLSEQELERLKGILANRQADN